MMFRKLYWVVEQVQSDGKSSVRGVYTSIPDLVDCGLAGLTGAVRLTLTKLDSNQPPVGLWSSPGFEGVAEDLQPYVDADDFSDDHRHYLIAALKARLG
jgi:hypothetical protein